jgi:pyrroloquinoline-quinone synthase
MTSAWTREEFETRLRAKGAFYHIYHPFNVAMNSGQCSPEQIRGWVANRFYYQLTIPIKDASILANCPDRDVRRLWIQRILDHDGQINSDGTQVTEGGIEAWLRLGEACGLTRAEILDLRHLLPGVKFAVDAYLNFARQATWQEAVCSSLTELFAPHIHQNRLDHWPTHYPWIDADGYQYFRNRLREARRDVEHGLAVTLDYFKTREQQEKALNILQFKLDILWSIMDAVTMAYHHKTPPYYNCEKPSHD